MQSKVHYYQFAVKLDKFLRRCNTLNNLSNKVCVSNKIEFLKYLKIHVFNMIIRKNESKILIRYIMRM